MIHSICSTCGKKYDEKDDGETEIRLSHGYCDNCFPEAMKNMRKQLEERKCRTRKTNYLNFN